jgi:hypothetical protein
MATLHIIAIDTGLEPHALRLASEAWGADVSVTWVGNSQQIVDYFATGFPHDIVVISGHGDERGLLLPELAVEIQHRYPYHTVITPGDFQTFVRLEQALVVNLACLGGVPAFANTFLTCGARAYIGPIDYPEGRATLMYVLAFIYTYLHNGGDIAAAHQHASRADDDRQQFRLYQRAVESV